MHLSRSLSLSLSLLQYVSIICGFIYIYLCFDLCVLSFCFQGESPPELQEEAIKAWGPQTDSVAVQLVNKSSEDYVPPPEKFSFAKSQVY